MPSRKGGERTDAIERVIAEVGLANIETVLDSYRRFAEKVDYRKLMDWSVKQPLDDLLQPLFLAALVTISRDLELSELAEEMKAPGVGEWEWGVRFDATRGTRFIPMADEGEARAYCRDPEHPESDHRYRPVRRRIGAWVEAADA